MNIINSTPTKPQNTRQHKNRVDLVPGSRDHHTHDYEVELEQAVAAGDKDAICEAAKQMVEHQKVNMTQPPQLLSVRQVASVFGLCTRSIWRMVANGELPPPILVGGARRWYQADIHAYLAQQTAKRDAQFHLSHRSMAA